MLQITPQISIDAAISAANIANLAYGKIPFPVGDGACYEMIDLLPAADVQCLVVTTPKNITFSFRGTQDNRGWLIDAKIAFKAISNGICAHTGFYEDVEAIWPRLKPMAMDAEEDGKVIFTTGHSKGAGECCQFTYRLAKDLGIKATQSIRFGEPRSFNRAGAEDYDSLNIPTLRIIHQSDVVCRIPWRMGLYRHVRHSAFFDAWGNIALDEPWFAHLPSDITAIVKEALRKEDALVNDHGIDKYIQMLQDYKARYEFR